MSRLRISIAAVVVALAGCGRYVDEPKPPAFGPKPSEPKSQPTPPLAIPQGSIHVHELCDKFATKKTNQLDRTAWSGSVTGKLESIEVQGAGYIEMVLRDIDSRRHAYARAVVNWQPNKQERDNLAKCPPGTLITVEGDSSQFHPTLPGYAPLVRNRSVAILGDSQASANNGK